METRDLLVRLVRLPVAARGLATGMAAGGFRSAFRGQGMEFEEARHYQWGDDARSIDWNASTRLGTPFVKVFREEREMAAMLVLDASASMHCSISMPWGSGAGSAPSPYEQALIACALIAFSAERNGQRVGGILFDSGAPRILRPGRGRRAALAFASMGLRAHQPCPPLPPPGGALPDSSDIRAALAACGGVMRRRSLVAVASDFLGTGWEAELGRLCRRHDVIAVRVHDPSETDPPDMGFLSAADPETGARTPAPTAAASFRGAWAGWHGDRAEAWRRACRRAGAFPLDLPTSADAAAALTRFFGEFQSSRS